MAVGDIPGVIECSYDGYIINVNVLIFQHDISLIIYRHTRRLVLDYIQQMLHFRARQVIGLQIWYLIVPNASICVYPIYVRVS